MKKIAQYFFGAQFDGLNIEPCDAIEFGKWYESTHHSVTQMMLEAAYEAAKWIWTHRKKQLYYIVALEGQHVVGGISYEGVARTFNDALRIKRRIEKDNDLQFSNHHFCHRGIYYHKILNDQRDIRLIFRICDGYCMM